MLSVSDEDSCWRSYTLAYNRIAAIFLEIMLKLIHTHHRCIVPLSTTNQLKCMVLWVSLSDLYDIMTNDCTYIIAILYSSLIKNGEITIKVVFAFHFYVKLLRVNRQLVVVLRRLFFLTTHSLLLVLI